MKKWLFTIFLCALTLCVLLGACNQAPETEPAETQCPDTPIEQALDHYLAYHEMAKSDPQSAIKAFCHYELEEAYEMALQYAYRTVNVEVLRIEQLSDQLWEIEFFLQGEGDAKYGLYSVDYVGIVDGEYKLMFTTNQIPEELKEGVEFEPYETHGPGIVDPEDIVGGLGEHVIGTQPTQP